MSSYEDNHYKNLLTSFTIDHLQNLLTIFGLNKKGTHQELVDRAINLLIKRPPGFNRQLFLTIINETHQSTLNQIVVSYKKLRMDTMLNQPQIMSLGMQAPRMTPQAGLPQVVPQTQRDMLSQVTQARQQPIQVSPNPVYGTNSTNTGNSFINTSIPPQSLANIRLQKLPFFEVVAEVIKPTILCGIGRRSQFAASIGMMEDLFELIMQPSHVNYILENLHVSDGKTKYPYQAQIRICLIKEGSTEITDFMPLGIHIRIDNTDCPLPPTSTKPGTIRRTARPINCTQQLMLNLCDTQTISVNWCPDGQLYVFALYIVKKLTPETLLMKLKEKPARSVDKTKNDIIRSLANTDPELASTSLDVSLKCPIGQVKMNLPAKSIKCDHLECFDAETFILMNEKTPTWMCPICKKPCLYDDLQIETYFLEIATNPNLADINGEIKILNDGTWRVFRENNEIKNFKSSALTKQKLIDFVNLDDSDDDNPTEFKKEIDGCVKKESTVDLTLNDNEDEATKENEQENETTIKGKEENEAHVVDVVQPITIAADTLTQVQPQQVVSSSAQDVIIELDSPSPPVTPTPTTTD